MAETAGPEEVEYDEENCKWRFKPRGLQIAWSSEKQYWKMPDKGTDDPAELIGVCWLRIDGSTKQPLHKGRSYALSFKITLKEGGSDWTETPAFIMAKVGKKGRAKWAKMNAENIREGEETEVPQGKLWFDIPENAADTRLYFGFYELWTNIWKRGLLIHEAVVEEMVD